jgi:hypothetical protein
MIEVMACRNGLAFGHGQGAVSIETRDENFLPRSPVKLDYPRMAVSQFRLNHIEVRN